MAINHVHFRAMLDQADAVLSERLGVASTEMLASTFIEVLRPIKERDDIEGAWNLIAKCGPSLKSKAVFALLKSLADELCRREEKKNE